MAIRPQDGDPCSSAEPRATNPLARRPTRSLSSAKLRRTVPQTTAYDCGPTQRTRSSTWISLMRCPSFFCDVTLADKLRSSVGVLNRLRNALTGAVAWEPGGELQPIGNASLRINPAEVTVDGARGQMQCR